MKSIIDNIILQLNEQDSEIYDLATGFIRLGELVTDKFKEATARHAYSHWVNIGDVEKLWYKCFIEVVNKILGKVVYKDKHEIDTDPYVKYLYENTGFLYTQVLVNYTLVNKAKLEELGLWRDVDES